jgi:hypothetical protein
MRGILWLNVAIALSACGGETHPAPAPAPAPQMKAAPVAKKGPSPEELTTGMVEAAAQGKSPVAVSLKFDLAERPKLGEPLEVNLALISQTAGGSATVEVTGADGFDVGSGTGQFEIPQVDTGEVYRHTLRVTPNAEGVAFIGLTVTLKRDEITDSKAFSIPIIVDR